jgi:hypothetical protein
VRLNDQNEGNHPRSRLRGEVGKKPGWSASEKQSSEKQFANKSPNECPFELACLEAEKPPPFQTAFRRPEQSGETIDVQWRYGEACSRIRPQADAAVTSEFSGIACQPIPTPDDTVDNTRRLKNVAALSERVANVAFSQPRYRTV